MARFSFAMNVSLDGYVDHERLGQPDLVLFRHWTDQVRSASGAIYGRRIYEIMRYWEQDQPGWTPDEAEFAQVWRRQPKWVVSRTRAAVGPGATLIGPDVGPDVGSDIAPAVRKLKADLDGEIAVCGTVLAGSLGDLGLIDEYQMYLHPVVLGSGTPFFAGRPPPLRLTAHDRIGETVVRLTYGLADDAAGRRGA